MTTETAITITIATPVRTLSVTSASAELIAQLERVRTDVEMAPLLIIDSADMLKEAEGLAARLKHAIDSIAAERVATVKPLNDTVKEVNAAYNTPRDQLQAVLDDVKAKMVGYSMEQQRLADEAAAADRRRREEEAQAAAQREAETRAQAERLAEQAQQQQAAGSEIMANALLQQAAAMVDEARTDAQQAVLELHSAPRTAAPVLAKGLRGTWSGEVTDKARLLVHVGDAIKRGDLSLLALFDVNTKALNTIAKLQAENLNLPGVQPKLTPTVAVSGKRASTALAA